MGWHVGTETYVSPDDKRHHRDKGQRPALRAMASPWVQLRCYMQDHCPRWRAAVHRLWGPLNRIPPSDGGFSHAQRLFNCDATAVDTGACAELRCLVHPDATDGQLKSCHPPCHGATLCQALRERGWASAHDLIVRSAGGFVLCTYALSSKRAHLLALVRRESVGPKYGLRSGQPHSHYACLPDGLHAWPCEGAKS